MCSYLLLKKLQEADEFLEQPLVVSSVIDKFQKKEIFSKLL